jgi:PhnB protein
MPGPDGSVSHAEMELADGVVMLGLPEGEYRNPKRLGGIVTQSLYVYVDDVDGHFQRAKAAGATIIREPKDQFWGDRDYGAEDPEGHQWYFSQHVRDVSPEEINEAMQQMAQQPA